MVSGQHSSAKVSAHVGDLQAARRGAATPHAKNKVDSYQAQTMGRAIHTISSEDMPGPRSHSMLYVCGDNEHVLYYPTCPRCLCDTCLPSH